MYVISKHLESLSQLLIKYEGHLAALNVPEHDALNEVLLPDGIPFWHHVDICCDKPVRFYKDCGLLTTTRYAPYDASSIGSLIARIYDTEKILETVDFNALFDARKLEIVRVTTGIMKAKQIYEDRTIRDYFSLFLPQDMHLYPDASPRARHR